VSPWMTRYGRLCRRLARAFPRRFRETCGDGLEVLVADVVPLVWRDQGVLGLARLTADLVVRLPMEYFASATAPVLEAMMTGDVFEGTWKAVHDKSQWDPNYTPEQACIRFEATDTGYLLVAYGIKDGEAVAERPTSIIADGRRRPVVDLNGRPIPGVPPGALAFGQHLDARTLEAGVEVDGQRLGGGSYRVSEDGNTLTVTAEGLGLKGPFKTVATFERVRAEPICDL